jgi:hypothetical protein
MPISLPPLPEEDHHCPACRYSYAATSVAAALALIESVPSRAAELSADLGEPAVRTRPEPGTWSALEYVCHLRDVYMTSTIRLHRVRTEDRPALEPMLNELRARRFGYRGLRLDAVLDELTASADGFRYEVGKVSADGWYRVGMRQPGEYRTALWLVRHAAHEGIHHLADIARPRTTS